MAYCIQFAGVTHAGLYRPDNQDNLVCNNRMVAEEKDFSKVICGEADLRSTSIFGVFDGMGGAQQGEIASAIAARNAVKMNVKDGLLEGLVDFCLKTNGEICEYAAENHLCSIGTTAAVLVFTSQKIGLCNVGDTKIFRISKRKMEQISQDHVVQNSNGKRYLTQNLGMPDPELTPYLACGEYKKADQYLLCSDGLTDLVSERDILRIVEENRFENVVPQLLRKALDNGGKDNVTIILCKVLRRLF